MPDRLAERSSKRAGREGQLSDGQVTASLEELEAELQDLLAGRLNGRMQGAGVGRGEGGEGGGKVGGGSAREVQLTLEAAGLVCSAVQAVERLVSAHARRRWRERVRQWGEEGKRGGAAKRHGGSGGDGGDGSDGSDCRADGDAEGGDASGDSGSAELQGAMVRVMVAVRQLTAMVVTG